MIDCPESGQDFGRVAKKTTSDLCFGEMVRIQPTATDRHGRTVAIVNLEDGRELDLELIKAGVVWHFTRYSDDHRYADAQARKARIWLWRDPNAIPPWECRSRLRGDTGERATVSSVGYHGNVKSGVFHGPN